MSEEDKAKIRPLLIRATERGAFRCGEWANLLGMVAYKPPGLDDRICYHVSFPDGATDYWAQSGKFDVKAVE